MIILWTYSALSLFTRIQNKRNPRMATSQIRFDDGAAYERYMGKWSRLAGATFIDWLAPQSGLRWLDIGCGNGAFTEMLVDRVAPLSVSGIDPSAQQLLHARSRPALHDVQVLQGTGRRFAVEPVLARRSRR
jgi:trans-aconitate methyltransferase